MELSLKKFVPAFLVAGALGFFSVAASAAPVPVCPPLGKIGAGCNVIVTLNPGGTGSVAVVNPTPYDGVEDQLVGLINNTGATVSQITITGTNIGGFDLDGGWAPGNGCISSGSNPNGCFTPSIAGDPEDYSGPNNIFVSHTLNTVVDNIVGGLANRASTYFTLEEPPTGGFTVIVTNAPEPASLALLGAGLAGLGFARRRRKLA